MNDLEGFGIADIAVLEFDEELYEMFPELSKSSLDRLCGLAEKYIRRVNSETWEKANEFYKKKREN